MSVFAVTRLDVALRNAGVPIDGVSGTQGNVRIDFQASATAAQRTQAQSIVAAFDWSDAADATFFAQQAKAAASAGIDNGALQSGDAIQRGLVGVFQALLDELNRLRQAIPHRITGIARSGTTATATTDQPHGLVAGNVLSIAGADQAYNGPQSIISAPNSTTFTFTVASTLTTPATGSMWYTRSPVAALLDITTATAVTAIKAKIAATAE